MSGARSSAGSSLRGLRGERRWAREGRTSRMSEPRLPGSERMRWMSCAGSFELFDQTAHHHLARLHEPHPFFPPLFQQMLGDVAVDRLHRVHDSEQPHLRLLLEQTIDRVLAAYVQRATAAPDYVNILPVDDV